MSLVVAAPFAGGVVIASDMAVTNVNTLEAAYGQSKLFIAGGVTASITGSATGHGRDGRIAFSLPHVIAQSAPESLKPGDLQTIANVAAEAMERHGVKRGEINDGAVVCFWFGATYARFFISNEGGTLMASEVTVETLDLGAAWAPVWHGAIDSARDVVHEGRLSHRSYGLLAEPRRRIRAVSLEDAIDYVTDVQETTQRAMRSGAHTVHIGGGIDLRIVGRDGKVTKGHASAVVKAEAPATAAPETKTAPAAPPSRSAPCHCGSGKKFKRCHGTAS